MVIAVSFISLCLASLVFAENTVAYGNYDNTSTTAPLGELKPMIVSHGTMNEDGIHSHNITSSEPMEVETDTGITTVMPENDSDSDFLNSSSMESSNTNSTESSTKPTHIMVIPRKNNTAVDGDNSTDSSMDKEASAATSEKDTHSMAAGSSASVLVVLALFTISTRLILSH